jgi:hypothetical protein
LPLWLRCALRERGRGAATAATHQPMSADAFALFSRFLDYDNTLPLNARTISRVDSARLCVRSSHSMAGADRGSRADRFPED